VQPWEDKVTDCPPKTYNRPLLIWTLPLPVTVTDQNQGAKHEQLSNGTNQASSREGSVMPNTVQTSDETGDPDQPELPVEGRVISWLIRKEDGGIVMGDLYPPGSYTLIACPDESKPSDLRGENISGNHAGWFSAPGDMSLSHSVPTTPGTYLLVKPTQDQCQ